MPFRCFEGRRCETSPNPHRVLHGHTLLMGLLEGQEVFTQGLTLCFYGIFYPG